MMWIIESVQSVVLPVDSQRILCQIIRANTEEINMLRQLPELRKEAFLPPAP